MQQYCQGLKNLKRNLKTFPGKNSFQKNAKIDEKLLKNSENSSKFNENNKNNDENSSKNDSSQNLTIFDGAKIDDSVLILGELLNHLRKNKLMSLLMICRNIKKIEIDGNVAVLDFGQNQSFDAKAWADIEAFFSGKGMSCKIKEQKMILSDIQKLNNLLGGNLKIINKSFENK